MISHLLLPAMVAQPAPKKDMFATGAAMKATRAEWARLWEKGARDNKDARE